MFNSKTAQFAWKNISVIMAGRPIAGITDLEYSVSKNLEPIFGAGQYAQFIGEGNKTFSGAIELLQNDYEALVDEAKKQGGDDITDMECNITIAYIPKEGEQLLKTVVDRLSGVKFSEDGKKTTQGDTHIKVSLPFVCLGVEKQI